MCWFSGETKENSRSPTRPHRALRRGESCGQRHHQAACRRTQMGAPACLSCAKTEVSCVVGFDGWMNSLLKFFIEKRLGVCVHYGISRVYCSPCSHEVVKIMQHEHRSQHRWMVVFSMITILVFSVTPLPFPFTHSELHTFLEHNSEFS